MARERSVVTALFLLLLGLATGFAVHRSSRFAGSAWGGVLGVSAAALMLVPLAYTLVERVEWLKERVGRRLPASRLLDWHIYATLLGAFLAILHTGHKFESWLGILLTAAMLLALVSGYAGRHLLGYVSLELRERQQHLEVLRTAYDELAAQMVGRARDRPAAGSRWWLRIGLAPRSADSSGADDEIRSRRTVELATAIADVEYSIAADTAIKARLRRWLVVHIGTSIAFYGLLVLHVVAAVQYGVRWFS